VLQQLRGVGPLVATALVATAGNGEQYSKCRQMVAALGLTPRQNSSGDKHRLFGISKRGDAYLRTLLIHGARAVVSQAKSTKKRLGADARITHYGPASTYANYRGRIYVCSRAMSDINSLLAMRRSPYTDIESPFNDTETHQGDHRTHLEILVKRSSYIRTKYLPFSSSWHIPFARLPFG